MAGGAVFDLAEALARVDDDADILAAMAEVFLNQGPRDVADARAAVAAQDAQAVARAAHRIKGAVLQLCAPSAIDAAQALESLAKTLRLEGAETLCDALAEEVRRLLEELRSYVAQQVPK